MFRPMRRGKQALSQEACIRVLEAQPRGVLAVHGEGGYPYALPIDFIWLDGKVYFHCANEGHKMDAIAADDKVSFCVMDEGFRKEGDWALNIQSVILFGRISKVTDPGEKEGSLRALALKYFPDPAEAEAEVAKYLDRVCMLALTVEHMTGKLVKES